MVRYSNEKDDDIFVHLTNFSINEKNKDYIINNDANANYGHKWFN